jgi:DNA-binding NarL/FixJ family response regulator
LKSILIVDDSVIIRRALRTLLDKNRDWEVCGEAENGQEGIDKARLLCPDLVLLDLSMPIMNGLQVARELNRLLPGILILMFTTFSNAHIEREALALGVSAVRSKSEGLDSLYRSIQDLLQTA